MLLSYAGSLLVAEALVGTVLASRRGRELTSPTPRRYAPVAPACEGMHGYVLKLKNLSSEPLRCESGGCVVVVTFRKEAETGSIDCEVLGDNYLQTSLDYRGTMSSWGFEARMEQNLLLAVYIYLVPFLACRQGVCSCPSLLTC